MALLWWASRCGTSTKAMPLSAGVLEKKRWKASSPPAEAPMPTIGQDDCEGLCSLSARGFAALVRFETLTRFAAWGGSLAFGFGVRAMRSAVRAPGRPRSGGLARPALFLLRNSRLIRAA